MDAKVHKWPRRDFLIHAHTQLGLVHLTVANLESQLEFYTQVLGMKLHWREGASAGLGVGKADLLKLTEVEAAQRFPQTTGMYHFALLYPNRRELARVIARLYELGYPNYPTDHVVSKTSYLDDPEGNNIELYIYSPEDGEITMANGKLEARWADGRPSNGREPLDLQALFSHLKEGEALDAPMPADNVIGHVHLYGSSLEDSMRFYSEVLGFRAGGMAQDFRMGDVTLDRPHVIAFNTWQGEGAQAPPPDSLGLRYYTIELPNEDALTEVLGRVAEAGIAVENWEEGVMLRDPSEIAIHLRVHQ
jgi:catechol 2,3-dioxygenase